MAFRITGFVSVFSIAVLVTGCAPSADQNTGIPVMTDGMDDGHDHGHAHGGHPETLTEALHELEELRDTVRDAFAKSDLEAAHGPLHEVGHLLEEVSNFGGKAELSADAKATIETNVEALLDAFGAVDKKMHGEDDSAGAAYKDVSDKIDAAISAISAAAAPALKEDEHAGHDHDEDGHHEHGDDDHKEGEHEHKDGDHDHKDGEHENEHKAAKGDAEKSEK